MAAYEQRLREEVRWDCVFRFWSLCTIQSTAATLMAEDMRTRVDVSFVGNIGYCSSNHLGRSGMCLSIVSGFDDCGRFVLLGHA